MNRVVLVALAAILVVAGAVPGQADDQRSEPAKGKKLRVGIVGAHPDDSESGCGGLLALLTQQGHEVVVGYLTCFRSDRKVGDEPEATVRRREAVAACQILGAK